METGSFYIAQTGFKVLGSVDLPASSKVVFRAVCVEQNVRDQNGLDTSLGLYSHLRYSSKGGGTWRGDQKEASNEAGGKPGKVGSEPWEDTGSQAGSRYWLSVCGGRALWKWEQSLPGVGVRRR